MALLRALRASPSNLSRHHWRTLSTSLPRHQAVLSDEASTTHATDADDSGPPTSGLYHPSTTNSSNPLRHGFRLMDGLSKHVEVLNYQIHVACTPNNTHNGCWSGGSCGFKGVNRSGYEAGYQCAVRAFARVKELAREVPGARFEFLFKGFGQGRDAVFKALMTSEGDDVRPFVNRVTDNTPIKIGGTRARKTRRL
ncbi:mitochondrial ribosomal protein subunit S18 [Lactarius hatsudake]|nr:mitochondrial ribosomal protein subunit S18 [Lactarius hatsudake]